MIVIYFNALILLIGFELNVSIYVLREQQAKTLGTQELKKAV